ncbi:MAG: DNA primase [Candidatus Eremiobacteraeota bacterium]|nr:DNA primase [Candidatus Eremiobacteraeota bacterium]
MDDRAKREVLARTDIGALVGDYVALRKRGNDLIGLCPFHAERTPSFHVHPDRGFFKCFGCGVGGDVFTFYERVENVTFIDALQALAKRAGVELQPRSPAASRARSERESIYAANAIAAAFFHRLLVLSPEGAEARTYCERRGLDGETIRSFMLGYAPASWDALVTELQREGVEAEIAVRAGLIRRGQRGFYDFYRERLMIPTHGITGEVIAFGGRSLGGAEPKYLNTSTTPVYTKGRGLFALDRARRAAAKAGALIVVEGYLDCIALHQAGFENAVASLGTSLTAEQAAELQKYAGQVFVCFDADAAGSAATAKSIETLVAAGFSGYGVRIVALAPGTDPDAFVREVGRDAFQHALEGALPWIQFSLDRRIERLQSDGTGPGAVAREAERLVRSTPREEWDRWRQYVADRLRLSADDLRAAARSSQAPEPFRAGAPFTRYAAPAELPTIERDLLTVLLEEPALVAEYRDRIPVERFQGERYRELYAALVRNAGNLERSSDVLAVLNEQPAAKETAIGLQAGERAALAQFRDSAERRLHLDRIVEMLAERADRVRMKFLSDRIGALQGAGQAIPQNERDEYAYLVEKLDRTARRRIGTKSG